MKVYRRRCKNFTNHRVVAEELRSFDPAYEDPWGEAHRFSQCAGCDCYSYSVESWTVNDWNSYTNEYDTDWKLYPSDEVGREVLPEEAQLPSQVKLIYKEVLAASNAQMNILPPCQHDVRHLPQ